MSLHDRRDRSGAGMVIADIDREHVHTGREIPLKLGLRPIEAAGSRAIRTTR